MIRDVSTLRQAEYGSIYDQNNSSAGLDITRATCISRRLVLYKGRPCICRGGVEKGLKGNNRPRHLFEDL